MPQDDDDADIYFRKVCWLTVPYLHFLEDFVVKCNTVVQSFIWLNAIIIMQICC